jgi:transposase
VEAQQELTVVRARDVLVRLRTAAVNAVRGLVKPCGVRLPSSSTSCFGRRCQDVLSGALLQALTPLLAQIEQLSEQIKQYDRMILEMSRVSHPETYLLRTVHGVGPVTALIYVLTLDDPHRFERSRDVEPTRALWNP